jgi:hypothetical protein
MKSALPIRAFEAAHQSTTDFIVLGSCIFSLGLGLRRRQAA